MVKFYSNFIFPFEVCALFIKNLNLQIYKFYKFTFKKRKIIKSNYLLKFFVEFSFLHRSFGKLLLQ